MPLRLLECMQAEMITQGVGRKPATAGSTLPPVWLAPRQGAVGPGQERDPYMHPTMVVSLYAGGGFPTAPFEGFWDAGRIVDVRIRSLDAAAADDLALELHQIFGDRQNWDMGGLHVEETQRYMPLQLISTDRDLGWDFLIRFMFWCRMASYLA